MAKNKSGAFCGKRIQVEAHTPTKRNTFAICHLPFAICLAFRLDLLPSRNEQVPEARRGSLPIAPPRSSPNASPKPAAGKSHNPPGDGKRGGPREEKRADGTTLTKDDFKIFDNRQPQQIASFSMESVKVAQEKTKTAAPLPQNTFTNRVELRPKAPNSVTVMLLDGLNTKFEDQVYAKQQLIKFLAELHAEDRVAVYTLGTQLKILHDFTATPRRF